MDAELRKQITDFIVEKINPDFIMLFGSQVTGLTHPESDTDLAFYKQGHQLSSYDVFILAGELAGITKTSVDLIDLDIVSTVFKMQIFGYGIPIYISNQFEFDEYQMNVMSMYHSLNVERREILQAITERGSVYDNQK